MFKARSGLRFIIGAGFLAASSVAGFAQQGDAAAQTRDKHTIVHSGFAETINLSVDIPTIDAVDANVDTDTLRAILSGDIAAHADELRHLTAESITVPTITVTYDAPMPEGGKPVPVTAVYKDVVLSGVTDGVAANSSVASVELNEFDVDITYNDMSAEDINFGAMLAFYGLVGTDPDTGWQTLYRNMQLEGGTVAGKDVNCTIGRIAAARAEARPLETSIFDMLDTIGKTKSADGKTPDPEAIAKLFKFIGDMATAMKTTPITSEGGACTFTEAGKTTTVSVGGVGVGAYNADAVYPEISVDKLDVSAADGSASVGGFVIKNIDYTGPLAVLNGAEGTIDDAWFEAHARELVPAFHGLSVKDVAFDVPDPEQPGTRVTGSVGGFDLSLDKFRNAVPTVVASRLENLVVDLPEQSTDPAYLELKAMGLSKIDLSYDFSASWDEATKTINFDTVKVDAASLGSVGLSLLLGNATKDLFNPDADMAMAAGMGLTFKSLGLDVVDNGLGAFVFAKAAGEEGVRPKDMRTMLSGMSQGMILGFLGSNPAASQLATAVGGLINNSTPLSATISATDPGGITLDTLETLEANPTAIGDMVTIKVDKAGE